MKLVAPSPDLPDDAELNDILLPFLIAAILTKAGFRTVGEVCKASDLDLLKYPRISLISLAYLGKTSGDSR